MVDFNYLPVVFIRLISIGLSLQCFASFLILFFLVSDDS